MTHPPGKLAGFIDTPDSNNSLERARFSPVVVHIGPFGVGKRCAARYVIRRLWFGKKDQKLNRYFELICKSSDPKDLDLSAITSVYQLAKKESFESLPSLLLDMCREMSRQHTQLHKFLLLDITQSHAQLNTTDLLSNFLEEFYLDISKDPSISGKWNIFVAVTEENNVKPGKLKDIQLENFIHFTGFNVAAIRQMIRQEHMDFDLDKVDSYAQGIYDVLQMRSPSRVKVAVADVSSFQGSLDEFLDACHNRFGSSAQLKAPYASSYAEAVSDAEDNLKQCLQRCEVGQKEHCMRFLVMMAYLNGDCMPLDLLEALGLSILSNGAPPKREISRDASYLVEKVMDMLYKSKLCQRSDTPTKCTYTVGKWIQEAMANFANKQQPLKDLTDALLALICQMPKDGCCYHTTLIRCYRSQGLKMNENVEARMYQVESTSKYQNMIRFLQSVLLGRIGYCEVALQDAEGAEKTFTDAVCKHRHAVARKLYQYVANEGELISKEEVLKLYRAGQEAEFLDIPEFHGLIKDLSSFHVITKTSEGHIPKLQKTDIIKNRLKKLARNNRLEQNLILPCETASECKKFGRVFVAEALATICATWSKLHYRLSAVVETSLTTRSYKQLSDHANEICIRLKNEQGVYLLQTMIVNKISRRYELDLVNSYNESSTLSDRLCGLPTSTNHRTSDGPGAQRPQSTRTNQGNMSRSHQVAVDRLSNEAGRGVQTRQHTTVSQVSGQLSVHQTAAGASSNQSRRQLQPSLSTPLPQTNARRESSQFQELVGASHSTQPGGFSPPQQFAGVSQRSQPGRSAWSQQLAGASHSTQRGGSAQSQQLLGASHSTQPGGSAQSQQPVAVPQRSQPGRSSQPQQVVSAPYNVQPGGSSQRRQVISAPPPIASPRQQVSSSPPGPPVTALQSNQIMLTSQSIQSTLAASGSQPPTSVSNPIRGQSQTSYPASHPQPHQTTGAPHGVLPHSNKMSSSPSAGSPLSGSYPQSMSGVRMANTSASGTYSQPMSRALVVCQSGSYPPQRNGTPMVSLSASSSCANQMSSPPLGALPMSSSAPYQISGHPPSALPTSRSYPKQMSGQPLSSTLTSGSYPGQESVTSPAGPPGSGLYPINMGSTSSPIASQVQFASQPRQSFSFAQPNPSMNYSQALQSTPTSHGNRMRGQSPTLQPRLIAQSNQVRSSTRYIRPPLSPQAGHTAARSTVPQTVVTSQTTIAEARSEVLNSQPVTQSREIAPAVNDSRQVSRIAPSSVQSDSFARHSENRQPTAGRGQAQSEGPTSPTGTAAYECGIVMCYIESDRYHKLDLLKSQLLSVGKVRKHAGEESAERNAELRDNGEKIIDDIFKIIGKKRQPDSPERYTNISRSRRNTPSYSHPDMSKALRAIAQYYYDSRNFMEAVGCLIHSLEELRLSRSQIDPEQLIFVNLMSNLQTYSLDSPHPCTRDSPEAGYMEKLIESLRCGQGSVEYGGDRYILLLEGLVEPLQVEGESYVHDLVEEEEGTVEGAAAAAPAVVPQQHTDGRRSHISTTRESGQSSPVTVVFTLQPSTDDDSGTPEFTG